jgi:HAD superfamily hydrolase (TIGR01484 family)
MERMNLLLCSDLDRTLIPNGPQAESPRARALLRELARRPEITLAYVSGRDRALIEAAIREWRLPVPAYAIGDVGTTIYEVRDGKWRPWSEWAREIAPDWNGLDRDELAALFADLDGLILQPPEQQGAFKLSYHASRAAPGGTLLAEVQRRLAARHVRASLIWSLDEARGLGLLDVLPAGATKQHAVRFLMAHRGFREEHTVFAGDSGNDLPALTGGLQAVLVRNAAEGVRQEALRLVEANGNLDRLYLARGGFLGMNGCYAAGVLEGLAHFVPEVERWLAARGSSRSSRGQST